MLGFESFFPYTLFCTVSAGITYIRNSLFLLQEMRFCK